MAAAVLKRGEAVVWLPPRSAGERSLGSDPSLLLMTAEPGSASVSLRRASLETLPALRSVRLVFDARDVSLHMARLPSLPAARLQRALPNLLEDQVLQDAQQCAWALSPEPGAERLVAAIDRQWLETVCGAFERRGIRVSAAWPAQSLRFAQRTQGLTLVGVGQSLVMIADAADGLGLGAGPDIESRRQAVETAMALGGDRQARGLTILAQDESWERAAREASEARGVNARLLPLSVPVAASIDLLASRRGGSLQRKFAEFDSRAWRLPGVLALATILIAVFGLNLHWWVLRNEQAALRARVDEAFFQVFPAGTTRVDPVLQLNRHVASLRARSGQASADDFVPLVSALGLALGTQAQDALQSIDYRDGRMKIRFRPGIADSRGAREALDNAARRQGLRLQFESEREPSAVVSVLR